MKLAALALASLIGLSSVAFADEATPYDVAPGAPGVAAPDNVGSTADYQPMQMSPQQRRQLRRAQRGQAQQGPMRAAVIAQFDRDGDGRLSPQERRHAARVLRRMARQLARGERRAARRQQMMQQQGPQAPGQPQVDVDVRW